MTTQLHNFNRNGLTSLTDYHEYTNSDDDDIAIGGTRFYPRALVCTTAGDLVIRGENAPDNGDEDLTITLEARADPYSYSPRRILATGSTAVVRVCS